MWLVVTRTVSFILCFTTFLHLQLVTVNCTNRLVHFQITATIQHACHILFSLHLPYQIQLGINFLHIHSVVVLCHMLLICWFFRAYISFFSVRNRAFAAVTHLLYYNWRINCVSKQKNSWLWWCFKSVHKFIINFKQQYWRIV